MASLHPNAQEHPFEIELEPLVIEGLGGVQSFAFGQHDNKWLIVGGRLDGLHRRQPWASFDIAGHNNQLIVVDPQSKQYWTALLTKLPLSIQASLSATNMQFIQQDSILYCMGGYGYSPVIDDHTTFDVITAIHVAEVIDAVIHERDITNYIRQIKDPYFQVTGGQVEKINEVFYLMGGQKFLGRYNPMGPDHGPGFIQEYTNAIKTFKIKDNGSQFSINPLDTFTDSLLLHRRDYNAAPQILENGQEGITMFSGVFRPEVDLPYLNSVTIDEQGYAEDIGFVQLFNHYHCPKIPIYSESKQTMHSCKVSI